MLSTYLFDGTPGSGKSYHATRTALDWLAHGKNVIANFPIDMKYFKGRKGIGKFVYLPGEEITVDYLLKFNAENHKNLKGFHARTVIIFDEAGIKFNSRSWNDADRREWLRFFATHRHFYFDIILIAQNDRMLDRQVRGCIETEFKHRQMSNYKFFGKFLSFICGGLFVAVEYFYPIHMYAGKSFFRLNRRKAGAYDTMALFSGQNTEPPKPKPPEIQNNTVMNDIIDMLKRVGDEDDKDTTKQTAETNTKPNM